MRKLILGIVALTIVCAGCTCNSSMLTVRNNNAADITEKVVVLNRSVVEQKLGKKADALVYVELDGVALASQCDDIDGDGIWDELAFLATIPANSSIGLMLVETSVDNMPTFTKRTNIRFGQKYAPFADTFGEPRLKSNDSPTISEIYQMEGPAWENDKVGFRNYYDARNGIDIFGKKTSEMVLDSAGIRGQNYHEMDDWGMDILKVANSLGAGAIAIAIGDSVYRIGVSDAANVKFITEGPVRAMLRFTFVSATAGDRKYDVSHLITLNAGDNYYSAKVTIDGLLGDEQLVTGIVNKHDCALIEDVSNGYKLFATHGAQAYTSENLGLGLIVGEKQYVSNVLSPMTGDGVTETYLVYLKISADTPSQYHFFSGWEFQDAGFKDQAYFIDQLKSAALKLSTAVIVE